MTNWTTKGDPAAWVTRPALALVDRPLAMPDAPTPLIPVNVTTVSDWL